MQVEKLPTLSKYNNEKKREFILLFTKRYAEGSHYKNILYQKYKTNTVRIKKYHAADN